MKKNKSIRTQIANGFLAVIVIVVIQIVISCLCLTLIRGEYQKVTRNRDNQSSTQEAVSGHYEWLDKLSISIETGAEFTGSLDPSSCSLGKWTSSVSEEDLRDEAIQSALDASIAPHETIHTLAGDVIELAKSDKNAAYSQYVSEIKPKTDDIIANLSAISRRYKEVADSASDRLQNLLLTSLIVNIIVAFLAVLSSFLYSRLLAGHISRPISAVAEWSRKLSLGSQDLDFAALDKEEAGQSVEIRNMIESFEKMAQSIEENVNVVKRVADGDMTAFVNIRSKQDSLGKNLYRMVQSNDLLFNEILEVASAVASNADQIAQLSHTLADSATAQAGAVSDLSSTVATAGGLSKENAAHAEEASRLSTKVSDDAMESSRQMAQLAQSVGQINEASKKVFSVIKSIEDIAFQTNILALNASVEAARAGAAGKGFAVVANEVRELANKSAQAATESRVLIENTVSKTTEGALVSAQTSETFDQMIAEIRQIAEIVRSVSQASQSQLSSVENIGVKIREITDIAANNAAISEESAATSIEMNKYADLLKQSMNKFQLRNREQGKAYIPPEKQDDPDFIRRANENYQRALETGRYGFEYLDESI